MYLIDTNVVSELRHVAAGHGDAQVAAWQARIRPADCYLSVVTLMELEIGVLRMERRDRRQGKALRHWLVAILRPSFAGRVLDIDARVAEIAARLQVPDPRPPNDALIAATALERDLVVTTRNVRDFAGTGALVLDPWAAGTVQEAAADYRL